MLAHLRIQNYALIKALDIDFQSGFTSITGETGAGKSILLGAIGLVMGDRGDSSAILDPSQKCVIEAEFNVKALGLASAFEARDLDYADHCTVRREWHPNGKSRSFINDTPVSVSELKWLGSHLLEIHSQHTGLLVISVPDQDLRSKSARAPLIRRFERSAMPCPPLPVAGESATACRP